MPTQGLLMSCKQNKLLYLAIIIPMIMITITIGTTLYYRVELQPRHDFIYALFKTGSQYGCGSKLKAQIFPREHFADHFNFATHPIKCQTPELYIFHVNNGTSTPTSMQHINNLVLAKNLTSTASDKYTVEEYCKPKSLLAWLWDLQNSNSVCLQKNGAQKKLHLTETLDPKTHYQFVFIGWITSPTSEKGKN